MKFFKKVMVMATMLTLSACQIHVITDTPVPTIAEKTTDETESEERIEETSVVDAITKEENTEETTENTTETIDVGTIEETIEKNTERTEEVFEGRVIPATYKDYYMSWEDICVIIIGSYTYTEHFPGEQEFALIGYNGNTNPLLLVGCTKADGFGEYCVYCFEGNRVYKADENIKGMLYYNATTKEIAVLNENQVWEIYTYYKNHIIWLKNENNKPDGFERLTLTPKSCSPPPTGETIQNFIFF